MPPLFPFFFSATPCDEQGSEWRTKFPALSHKKAFDCTTASHFTAAKGEDSEGGVSPYGLGLGKTLLAAYNSGFTNPDTGEADHPDELKTEDTQVGAFL